ncbi:galectin-1-like isoform X2 [Notamacropus eugenii]|uniref:galectin-1-like isoform X2 n=1 Tax=Notamacropus eugenii TaxID=9315 RepID=UPI003B671257
MAGENREGKEIHLKGLSLQSGAHIKIKGFIRADAKMFKVNLGKDEFNIGMQFSPHFNYFNAQNTVVYNSKIEGLLSKEEKETNFPFEDLHTIEVDFGFEEKQFTVRMQNSYEFMFPNRLELQKIDFMSVYGDFYVRRVDFM